MLIPVVGLDRRTLPKKDGSGTWAIALCKLETGDVAEIFIDAKSCPDFRIGASLALDTELSTYDKKLGIKVKSIQIAK